MKEEDFFLVFQTSRSYASNFNYQTSPCSSAIQGLAVVPVGVVQLYPYMGRTGETRGGGISPEDTGLVWRGMVW